MRLITIEIKEMYCSIKSPKCYQAIINSQRVYDPKNSKDEALKVAVEYIAKNPKKYTE